MRNYWLTKSIDTGYCTAEAYVYIFCPFRHTSFALYDWKCSKQLDAWIKYWQWAAKRIIGVLHSLHAPALTHLHTYYNSLVAHSLSRRKGCEFPAHSPALQPPEWQSCCQLSCPGCTAAFPMSCWFTHSSYFLNVF